jgi:uncharacterized protein (DUF302 family)
MDPQVNNGIVNVSSSRSVDDSVWRIRVLLEEKGITLFTIVDHSGEAGKVGMTMRPTKLLVFGSPKAGTPLMIASPTVAIDLPLKLLVWEDSAGKVWISYNSTEYLRDRHGLSESLAANIALVPVLAAKAAE